MQNMLAISCFWASNICYSQTVYLNRLKLSQIGYYNEYDIFGIFLIFSEKFEFWVQISNFMKYFWNFQKYSIIFEIAEKNCNIKKIAFNRIGTQNRNNAKWIYEFFIQWCGKYRASQQQIDPSNDQSNFQHNGCQQHAANTLETKN
jgi:hypothetical protein